MEDTPTRARTTLSDRVAEEIRAAMARRRISGARLALALGVSPMWVSNRLGGRQPIDLNDLERIADVLGRPVGELLPADVRSDVRSTVPKVAGADRPRDNRPPGRPGQDKHSLGRTHRIDIPAVGEGPQSSDELGPGTRSAFTYGEDRIAA